MQRKRKCQRDSGSEAKYLMLISNDRNKGNYPQNVKKDKIDKSITELLEKHCN